ncbi:hypothetical protein [Roseibium aggregatum]|uniref:Uncharacterized protein n=1 Tax=Roseibium aggregatum TaxID=187304 RepID=A0A926P1H5_9HYPH|nr:hypothetical protein [Roseibium aggregatum]MBD1548130.1 hypothetical protein [Roseibium aggregatum]
MQRRHRRAHAAIWTLLAIVLPVALAVIFLSYPRLSRDAPAIRLDEPGKTAAGQS